ncbi:MAG: ATP-dependent helicase [Rhodothalassiaceae bacterium]
MPHDAFDPAHLAEPTTAATPYLDGLNDPQRAAVETLDGPVLVLAGAGTGKTRVLTTRIAHLLATRRAFESQILAVTFTNKAAREMTERVERLLGHPIGGMAVGTFHSIAARMLRGAFRGASAGAELVGLKPNFTILDTDDQIRLIKQLLEAERIDEKRWPARLMASLIDRWKNRALTPDPLPEAEKQSFANGLGGKIYAEYQARLATLNACDFGDLLLHCIRIFQSHPDVLADYHRRFRYLLVDEYQDTNVAQYLWLRLLAQAWKNICCVGDDDQSIYGWRGAEVGNILRFETDFPGARIIRLEQNYRSTGHILAAASGLIAANEGRLGKTLWTEAGAGEPVTVTGVWDSEEEARRIGDEIEALQTKKVPLNQIAVLVRAGFQTREFEERFITLGLSYRVIGGPRFYERREIRDALAYLRVIAQADDDLAFERIINVPKRGIGKASLQALNQCAREQRIPVTRAARRMIEAGALKGKARTTLAALLADFDQWRAQAETLSPVELTELVLDESGYVEMWRQDKSAEAPGRVDNLQELVRSIADFDTLGGFLEHVQLVMEATQGADQDAATLMTLHAAKGLEFDHVFLPGWEEGLFPNQRAIDESGLKGLEEERRLAYVGLTRARARAHIFFAGNRRIFGQYQSQLPSRFVDELPQDHIEMISDSGLYGHRPGGAYGWGAPEPDGWTPAQDAPHRGPGWARAQARGLTANPFDRDQPRPRRTLDLEPDRVVIKDTEVSQFAIGERVFHDKFGYGTITDMDGNKLTVDFDHTGEKRIMDRFVTATG